MASYTNPFMRRTPKENGNTNSIESARNRRVANKYEDPAIYNMDLSDVPELLEQLNDTVEYIHQLYHVTLAKIDEIYNDPQMDSLYETRTYNKTERKDLC